MHFNIIKEVNTIFTPSIKAIASHKRTFKVWEHCIEPLVPPEEQLHKMFGVVFQSDVLFADTIKENIAFGRRLSMEQIEEGLYEAPTAVRLEDGRWCLFLDYYGVKGAGQGYVPFVASSLADADFVRSDGEFSFPYGFKHGTILPITPEEYERMKAHDWSDVPDNR